MSYVLGGFINLDWSAPYLDSGDNGNNGVGSQPCSQNYGPTFNVTDNTTANGNFTKSNGFTTLDSLDLTAKQISKSGITLDSNNPNIFNLKQTISKTYYSSTTGTGTLNNITIYDNSGNYARYRDSSNIEYYLRMDYTVFNNVTTSGLINLDIDSSGSISSTVSTGNLATLTFYGIQTGTNYTKTNYTKNYDIYGVDANGNALNLYSYANMGQKPITIQDSLRAFNLETSPPYLELQNGPSNKDIYQVDGISCQCLLYNGGVLPVKVLDDSASVIKNNQNTVSAFNGKDFALTSYIGSGDYSTGVPKPTYVTDSRNIWSNESTTVFAPSVNGSGNTCSSSYLTNSVSYNVNFNALGLKGTIITAGFVSLVFTPSIA